MNENTLIDDTKEDLKLKIIDGGKKPVPAPALAGKEPTSICWLRDLEEGTIFLVKDKARHEYVQNQFEIVEKTNTSVKLFTMATQPIFVWVEPFRFCNRYDFVEILAIKKEEVPDD